MFVANQAKDYHLDDKHQCRDDANQECVRQVLALGNEHRREQFHLFDFLLGNVTLQLLTIF